jgi:hypothetical protein
MQLLAPLGHFHHFSPDGVRLFETSRDTDILDIFHKVQVFLDQSFHLIGNIGEDGFHARVAKRGDFGLGMGVENTKGGIFEFCFETEHAQSGGCTVQE